MSKLKNIFEKRRVEAWKMLKIIREMLRFIICVLLLCVLLVVLVFALVSSNNAEGLLNLFNENLIYLEMLGNMVLIPLEFCFYFFIIDLCSEMSMYFISNEMNEEEKRKVNMV